MGDIQAPAATGRRGQKIQEVVDEVFRAKESFREAYTQSMQVAFKLDRTVIILAGSPTTASTVSLYESIESNDVYQALASFHLLPVDVLGDDSALTRTAIATLSGHTIAPTKTTLLVMDREMKLLRHTTIEALASGKSSREFLNGQLIKFLKAD